MKFKFTRFIKKIRLFDWMTMGKGSITAGSEDESKNNGLFITELEKIFVKEIKVNRGKVIDKFADSGRIFLRATLPIEVKAQSKDIFKGGVALRSIERITSVYPYIYRVICKNGAILAHSLQSSEINANDVSNGNLNASELNAMVRDTITSCCQSELFMEAMESVKSSIDKTPDISLLISSIFDKDDIDPAIFFSIVKNFLDSETLSSYDFMNAVTAVARDTADPESRWNLEKLGGIVPFTESVSKHSNASYTKLLRSMTYKSDYERILH